MPSADGKKLTVLLSPTRRCNLRCAYCYVPAGPDRPDMSEEDFRSLYAWTARFCREEGIRRVEFSWFGGEPLLFGEEKIDRAISLQSDFLDPAQLRVSNRMQSNLALASERTCDLLRRRFDGIVGGSFEPRGTARRLPDGSPAAAAVERKMEMLRREGIRLGIVCTLTAADLLPPEELYEWFRGRADAVRVNRAHPPPGASAEGYLSVGDYTRYVLALFDLYTRDPRPGCALTNFVSIARAILLGTPLSCADAGTPDWKIAASGGGALSSCCRILTERIGDYRTDEPRTVAAALRAQAAAADRTPAGCRGCPEPGNGLCRGACPGEPDRSCLESGCGYRTEYTRDAIDWVRRFLAGRGIETAEDGLRLLESADGRGKENACPAP